MKQTRLYIITALCLQMFLGTILLSCSTENDEYRKDSPVWIEVSGIKKHITFHCGRHSYASLLLENGVDIYTIKSLMGHTNVKTTQIYTHIVNEQKEKAANTLHIENLDL